MGLACSQVRFLALTARKADCEYGISVESMHKMALTREMTELSQEYYSRLQSKNIAFYSNGKYNKINYSYLMGYGINSDPVLNRDKYPLKEDNSMILSDYKGQVILSNEYADAITTVLGPSAMGSDGRGGTFSLDNIAAIIAALLPGSNQQDIQTVIDDGMLESSSTNNLQNTLTGESTGEKVTVDTSQIVTDNLKSVVSFYYAIFSAAASNGWTTEYNKEMFRNEDYISDALVTGTFQLTSVDEFGQYDEQASLTYYVTAGLVAEINDSDKREEVTAWYNAEKDRISEKETQVDLTIDNLSTELEAINTELQSIQSLIDDAISSVFDWGSG